MSLDRDMLQRWLTRQRRSLSLQEIYSAWEPTWSLEEVEAMLRELRRQQAVQIEGARAVRYRVPREAAAEAGLS